MCVQDFWSQMLLLLVWFGLLIQAYMVLENLNEEDGCSTKIFGGALMLAGLIWLGDWSIHVCELLPIHYISLTILTIWLWGSIFYDWLLK